MMVTITIAVATDDWEIVLLISIPSITYYFFMKRLENKERVKKEQAEAEAEAEARREHERRELEMLDNIQRGEEPSFPDYRGQLR
ncbi:MAG: hypothetical protein WAP55_01345 [Minisyncoccia bacterium]